VPFLEQLSQPDRAMLAQPRQAELKGRNKNKKKGEIGTFGFCAEPQQYFLFFYISLFLFLLSFAFSPFLFFLFHSFLSLSSRLRKRDAEGREEEKVTIFRRWKGIGCKKSRASPALEGMQGGYRCCEVAMDRLGW